MNDNFQRKPIRVPYLTPKAVKPKKGKGAYSRKGRKAA